MGVEHEANVYTKKRIAPRDREPNGAIFMLRCAELNLTGADLDELTVGMVYDMLIEKANDNEKYDKKAPPGSMAAFFKGELNLGE